MGRKPKKKLIKKIKAATKKVTSAVKGKVKNKIANLAESKGYVVLTPYKPIMRLILKKRGHEVSRNASIKVVANLFNDVVIQGKNNFDYAHYANMQHVYVEATVEAAKLATSVIKQILAWFKTISDKKKLGQQLTEEERIAEEADKKVEEKGEAVTDVKNEDENENWFTRLINSIFGRKKSKKENFRRRISARNASAPSVMRGNMPHNSIVTAQTLAVRPLTNATELGYALATKKIGLQNLSRKGNVMSANDILNISPNNTNGIAPRSNKRTLQPQPSNITWFQKGGVWYYVDARGKTHKG